MRMKRIILIGVMFVGVLGMLAQGNLTAQQVLTKAAAVMSNSKGVEARFNVGSPGYSGAGVILSLSPKYHVSLPEAEVWFNGKELYTLNKNTDEVTVVYPTAEELAESNPMAYVSEAGANYNIAFSTVKKPGKYVLELTPKKKMSEVKRITLTLRQNDFVPEKIVIEPKSGSPVTAEINSFKTGVAVKNVEFEYPKGKYPKVEIIDLR